MSKQLGDAQKPVTHRVLSRGVNIHVVEHLKDTPDKPVLLLVHGHRAHLSWWDGVLPILSTRYRVFAMDFSGMGDSDRRAETRGANGYSQDGHARDLQCVVDYISHYTKQVVSAIIAHSWGGQITLVAAAANPSIASQLLILDSYCVLPGEVSEFGPVPIGNRRLYPSAELAAAAFRLSPPQPIEPKLLVALAHKSMCNIEGGWCWKFDPNLSKIEPLALADVASKLTLPVSIIYGAMSSIVSAERAARVVHALPQGRGPIAVAGAYHHLMLDHPEDTARVVMGVLAGKVGLV